MSKRFTYWNSLSSVPSFVNDYSLLFDGVNDYVDCGSIATLQSTSQHSLSAWFKTSDRTKRQGILKWYNGTGQWIEMSMSTTEFLFIPSGVSGYGKTPSSGVSNGVWNHVVMVFDGSATGNSNRLKAYLNGAALSLSFTGSIPTTTTAMTGGSFKIGERFVGQDYFLGNIDEPAVFDYALTQTNVTDIYNSGAPTDLNSLTTAPAHWYRNGDSDTYPTITDIGSAASNDGTMVNMDAADIVTDVP